MIVVRDVAGCDAEVIDWLINFNWYTINNKLSSVGMPSTTLIECKSKSITLPDFLFFSTLKIKTHLSGRRWSDNHFCKLMRFLIFEQVSFRITKKLDDVAVGFLFHFTQQQIELGILIIVFYMQSTWLILSTL